MVESYGMIFTQKNFEELQILEKEFNIIPRLHLYMVIKTFKYKIEDIIKCSNKTMNFKISRDYDKKVIEGKLEFQIEIIEYKLSHNKDEIEILDKNNKIIFKANVIF